MTREEVKKLYFKVCDLFPNFKPKDPQATFDTWVTTLAPYRSEEVETTLQRFIEDNPGGYTPNISQLIPKKDPAGFTGRHYTHAELMEMEKAALGEFA